MATPTTIRITPVTLTDLIIIVESANGNEVKTLADCNVGALAITLSLATGSYNLRFYSQGYNVGILENASGLGNQIELTPTSDYIKTSDGTNNYYVKDNYSRQFGNDLLDIVMTKADTDLSNVPTTKGILTESYDNSGSWYRVYSDGWCEQGGVIGSEGTTRGQTQSISFAKPFRDRNYTIIAVDGNTSKTNYSNSVAIATILNSTKAETGVSVGLYGFAQNDVHGVVNWVAYGYII